MPTALITGITGQDGSYLAEHLLGKGYRVVGVVRRSSTSYFERIGHILDSVELVSADLLDQHSLTDVVRDAQPDEVYNLAAQSFVQTSWTQPVLTGEFTALGVTRMLEALKKAAPGARFYQASSSEQFGKVVETPQREETPFYPRSPYGVAKVYGHWITVNYRESFGLYAVSGILFNHECIAETTPLVVRRHGVVNVVTADELVSLVRDGPAAQTVALTGTDVWDASGWTPVRAVTATRRRATDARHAMRWIEADGGAAEVTAHHVMLDSLGRQVPAGDLVAGDEVALVDAFPRAPAWAVVTPAMAEFLGVMTADAHVATDDTITFTTRDQALRTRIAELWARLFLGATADVPADGGAMRSRAAGQLQLHGAHAARAWLREQLRHSSGMRRVPPLVLNASAEIQAQFLCGYYAGCGFASSNRERVATSSPLLAQGLCWLYANQGRVCSVSVEHDGSRTVYRLGVAAPDKAHGASHLRDSAHEIRRVVESPAPSDWVFDLETESGTFCAGVGRVRVHNSPRRGLEFVTRKISDGVARIVNGLSRDLPLGNLDARRDWGFAGDYVDAMWRMLQQDAPDDYVIGTGETWSVREFCEAAFGVVGLDFRDYVRQDERFFRPAEVDLLVSDPSKARAKLGWSPTVGFSQLVGMMVEADLARYRRLARP